MITGADQNKAIAILRQLRQTFPKTLKLDFSGSSPPDVFVGRFGYPHIFSGILAPPQHDENSYVNNSPEEWFKRRLRIDEVLTLRGGLIYSRFKTNTKSTSERLKGVMQEVAMASKPADVEFFLKKMPRIHVDFNNISAPIANPAPLLNARIESNIRVDRKVDYFVDDTDAKASDALHELYANNTSVTSLIRLLAAGLLGVKTERKLVPSRWATTAVDSILSESFIKNVKEHAWIDEFLVFHDEYVGNNYVFLLIPDAWSFEVIEIDERTPSKFWHDYEGHFRRKGYAESVTGAYYVNRLAAAEYLLKMRRQASVVVFREVKRSYWAHLGVGILREVSKGAFSKEPLRFNTLEEAIKAIRGMIGLPLDYYTTKSVLLKEHGEQRKLVQF